MHTKILSFFVILLSFFCITTIAYSSQPLCPDPECDDPISIAARDYAQQEEETFGEMSEAIMKNDTSWIKSCLDGLNGIGLGLSLDLPDFSGIISSVCKMAVNEANKRINALKGQYTYSALGGLAKGTASTGMANSSVRVRNVSDQTAAKLAEIIGR
jgi:hypothetical protein